MTQINNYNSFINNKLEDCIIIGNPGCGKTYNIIKYCTNFNSNEFLIIPFSKKTQNDLIEKGNKHLNINNVKTIEILINAIYKKIYDKTSKNINNIIVAFNKNLENEDLTIINCLTKYKFIIIDDAQEINENQYNLIKLITTKLNIPLVLVGNIITNILLNHSKKHFYLNQNYRSTIQIINFCNFIIPNNYLPIMEGLNTNNGSLPLIYCESINNILLHIKNELMNNEYKLHDIAIIGPVKISKISEYNTYKSIGLELVCNYLNENNIKFIKYYNDQENNDIKIKENYVNILTCNSCKGLEFKKVLVINYHLTTFSKIPTESEYNYFKHLWYNTLTRANEKLIIYVDKNKKIFSKIPKKLYIHDSLPLKYINVELTSNKKINLDILNVFNYTINNNILYNINCNILDFDNYSKLYSKFIKILFIFYYYKNNNDINTFINIYKEKIDNTILVSNNNTTIINNLQKKGLIKSLSKNLIKLYINNIDKLKLSEDEYNFILYCKKNTYHDNITIILENNLFYYEPNKLKEMYNSLLNNDNQEYIIFNIILYYYQIKNECSEILNYDFIHHFNSIKEYFDEINNLNKNKNNYNFEINSINNHLDIFNNTIDLLIDNNIIIELIFCKNINTKNILQILLKNNNFYFKYKMEIWNLYDGKKYIINFNDNIWNFNCYLCDILEIKMNNNIFILDIETNTIDENIDFTEPSNTEIIDRYVYEYNFNIPISDGLIKNKYKLTTSHITGITENDLINSDSNLNKFKNDINNIMKYCDKPLFIAHNGNNFDFKILYYHKILNHNEILTLDTLYLFRLFLKEKNVSNKLINLYNKICNKNIIQVHRAKEDTLLIYEIFKKLNFSINEIFYLK